MFTFFERVKVFVLKHKCLLSVLAVFFYLTWEMWFVEIITPIRCKMSEGKDVEVFMTPEEWRKASGVNESLAGTEWISYQSSADESTEEGRFLIKNREFYQPIMYFYGNEHNLASVNSKHPNLSTYRYINTKTMLGHDTYILYDHKINEVVLKYNSITGYYRSFTSGLSVYHDCKDFSFDFLENYFN